MLAVERLSAQHALLGLDMLFLSNPWTSCLQIILTDPEGISLVTVFKPDYFLTASFEKC